MEELEDSLDKIVEHDSKVAGLFFFVNYTIEGVHTIAGYVVKKIIKINKLCRMSIPTDDDDRLNLLSCDG